MTAELLALCGVALLAGFIDSVVGGGGLILLPGLLILLPSSTPIPTVFGTNKLVSICGTLVAAWTYSRHVRIDWRSVGAAAVGALAFAALGATAVRLLSPALLRPLVLGLLVAVAIYTFARKDFGALHAPRLSPGERLWIGLGIGSVLGFYDGFFGPGTGSFLIFIFIGVFGFDFLAASAAAKVINGASNLSALGNFALTGHVIYTVALPMAACSVLGALIGTRTAILRGSRFVRRFFLAVVSAIICKLAYDTLRAG